MEPDNDMKRPILIATLGGSWSVVPEAYAFTNPAALPLYAQQFEPHPPQVGEIWVVTTARAAEDQGKRLAAWARRMGVALHLWWPEELHDIDSADDARQMADLIHRLVYFAERQSKQPPVLSLAGGRKTMSADLQRAGQSLGHSGLVHVLDHLDKARRDEFNEYLKQEDAVTAPLPGGLATAFTPVLISPTQPRREALAVQWDQLAEAAGSLSDPGPVPRSEEFLAAVEDIQRRADNLLANYRLQLSSGEPVGNFRALYALPRQRVEALRNTCIGTDPRNQKEDLAWLQALPKAELHCHLGGVLDVPGLITVAGSEAERVREARRELPEMARELARLEDWVHHDALETIAAWLGTNEHGLPDWKFPRRRWPVAEPVGVCAFLLAFEGNPELLDELLYGSLVDPRHFHAIGIERYESLGDLQGSGLLQSRATLNATLHLLAKHCREHHIHYLELRCSPMNYTRGGLTGEEVVDCLLDAAEVVFQPDIDLRLIFIASRHGKPENIEKHIDLSQGLLEQKEAFRHRFVGFDLAGAEHVRSPVELRDSFRPLRERLIHLTIHAGEGEPVENIWQAAFELNADRIGHGLTLGDHPELRDRFRDRKIALEMCPSSNDQIVGFRDHLLERGRNSYPLAEYLAQRLRVTVNTDDPGISRTNLSREYYKAAALTRGGLSQWQVLQLIRNGFRAAFCSQGDRQHHLVEAEKEIVEQLTGGSST